MYWYHSILMECIDKHLSILYKVQVEGLVRASNCLLLFISIQEKRQVEAKSSIYLYCPIVLAPLQANNKLK